jgi:CubicO group peptidase (beta-lactamase class C family)
MVRFLTALLLVSSPQQLEVPADSLETERVVGALGAQLDSQLTRFAEYGFSGTVLVVRDRRVVLLKGYGLADAQRGVRNSPATRFEMNSMTKLFTGVSILQLAGAGRLGLDDPVERYLGELPPEKRGATIRHLASHTAGLIVAGTDLAVDSRDSFVRDVKRTPREAAAGTAYRYTNAGFSLLAAIIEVASGQTYEAYLRQHAFAPAGMRTATFRDQVPAGDSLFAHGYVGTPAGRELGPPNPYVWGTRGAGGVWATVGDMYRWLVAVEDGVVLDTPQRQLLFSPPVPPSEEAFGWHVRSPGGDTRRQIDKGGGSPDFASQLIYFPDDRVVMIWTCNDLRQRWRRTLNQALPAIVFGPSPTMLPPVTTLPAATLAARAGSYRAGRDAVEFRATSDHLYALSNTLGVPTDVRFFAQDSSNFTAFDPATGAITRLRFGGRGGVVVEVELSDGRRVTAAR